VSGFLIVDAHEVLPHWPSCSLAEALEVRDPEEERLPFELRYLPENSRGLGSRIISCPDGTVLRASKEFYIGDNPGVGPRLSVLYSQATETFPVILTGRAKLRIEELEIKGRHGVLLEPSSTGDAGLTRLFYWVSEGNSERGEPGAYVEVGLAGVPNARAEAEKVASNITIRESR